MKVVNRYPEEWELMGNVPLPILPDDKYLVVYYDHVAGETVAVQSEYSEDSANRSIKALQSHADRNGHTSRYRVVRRDSIQEVK